MKLIHQFCFRLIVLGVVAQMQTVFCFASAVSEEVRDERKSNSFASYSGRVPVDSDHTPEVLSITTQMQQTMARLEKQLIEERKSQRIALNSSRFEILQPNIQ